MDNEYNYYKPEEPNGEENKQEEKSGEVNFVLKPTPEQTEEKTEQRKENAAGVESSQGVYQGFQSGEQQGHQAGAHPCLLYTSFPDSSFVDGCFCINKIHQMGYNFQYTSKYRNYIKYIQYKFWNIFNSYDYNEWFLVCGSGYTWAKVENFRCAIDLCDLLYSC